jgi:hypothetical protein
MGLGPKGSSLLHKLGQKPAYELTEGELLQLVSADRERRVTQRTLGRVMRQAADKKPKTTKSGKKTAPAGPTSLESLGLDPNVIAKLRADGKTDAQLILLLRKAGLVK